MAMIVIVRRRELITLDVGLRLVDVDKVVVDLQLKSLGVDQDGIEFCPLPQRIDKLLWIVSEGYRSSSPLYFFDT